MPLKTNLPPYLTGYPHKKWRISPLTAMLESGHSGLLTWARIQCGGIAVYGGARGSHSRGSNIGSWWRQRRRAALRRGQLVTPAVNVLWWKQKWSLCAAANFTEVRFCWLKLLNLMLQRKVHKHVQRYTKALGHICTDECWRQISYSEIKWKKQARPAGWNGHLSTDWVQQRQCLSLTQQSCNMKSCNKTLFFIRPVQD